MATIYGPDINSKQGDSGLPASVIKQAGDQFVAIKAGGGNVGLYEAPHYRAQVDSARAAGLPIVHYFVSGDQTIAAQAKYFISLLYRWHDGDAIAFDNEQLDSTGKAWGDKDATLFINTIRGSQGVNCPPAAAWHYGSAGSLFRARGPWPLMKATGATQWVAAYPGPPDMTGTGLTAAVHQYTDSHPYPNGMTADRNVTSKALAAIFPKRSTVKPAKPGTGKPGKTTTAITGSPGKQPSNAWKRLQLLAHLGGYSGPNDGILGIFSWEGVQQALKDAKLYGGLIDGDPAELTFAALERWAGSKQLDRASSWTAVTRANWRLIGKRLNTL